MDAALDLLTLSLLPEVGARTVRNLCARVPAAETVARPAEHADLLTTRAIAALRSGEARRRADREWRRALETGVQILGRDDAGYPGLLRLIYDPPPVVYVQGRVVPDEGERSVALVGSRAASASGVLWARRAARDLARSGVTIVSGLARGVDSAGHQGALDAAGRTVAVLGSGLDRIYPPENVGLARAIVQTGGALVSELPFGSEARGRHFPSRNRIIAGWGRAVVVVEARARSGALITASVALEEGREVLAVPGHPGLPGSEGANALLRDGARLVRDAADVLEDLGISPLVPAAPPDRPATEVNELLPEVPTSVEELAQQSGQPVEEILARLGELELHQRVKRLPGALFVRI